MSPRNDTITPKSKVPIYVVGSAVGLAVLMTAQWMNLKAQVANISNTTLTVQQAQEWIDDARDLNPNVKWPRLPLKATAKTDPLWTQETKNP